MTQIQAVSDLQLNQLIIEWVPHSSVKPNKYNPNMMIAEDRELLRQSLLEDGWTQPIVTLPDGTIVDGEQRWTVAGLPITVEDIDAVLGKMLRREEAGHVVSESIRGRLLKARERIAASDGKATLATLTGGKVPITRVDLKDDAHKMISTIRHNRARGVHSLALMADILDELLDLGLDNLDLESRLGVSEEETQRLLAYTPLTNALDFGDDVSKAWQPVSVQELTEDQAVMHEIERSRALAKQAKKHEVAKVKWQRKVDEIVERATEGKRLTQDERLAIRRKAESETELGVAPPKRTDVHKFIFFVNKAEAEVCQAVLGTEKPAEAFVALCQEKYERMAAT